MKPKDEDTVTKSLICELTDKERENYGIRLATTLEDIETVEAEKKKHADHFKDRIAGMQASADEIRRKVSSGQEWRDVACRVMLGQPDPSHKQVVRLDTGEVVETKVMTDDDRQTVLALEDDANVIEADTEIMDGCDPMPEADDETPDAEGY